MIFVLAVIAIFIAVSIYLFFKVESLTRELSLMKKELFVTKKENKNYVEVTAVIANRYEETSKQRFAALRDTLAEEAEKFDIIAPMINNYATIFNDSLLAKGQLQPAVQKVYEGCHKGSYKVFCNYIAQSDKAIKRAWSSNNINGFIILIEAILQVNNKK
jgi:hypothetical protein